MVNLIGADGKKTLQASEKAQFEALQGDSIARETGSVPQEFTRIREIKYHDGVFEFKMKPSPYDLSDTKIMPVGEVMTKLHVMRAMLRKTALVDPKMASEMLIELERKLIEAVEQDEDALQQVQAALLKEQQVEQAQRQEDRANGIIRFPEKKD